MALIDRRTDLTAWLRTVYRVAGRLAGVGTAGFALGALTAFGQGALPGQLSSLANSSGPWVLVACLLALLSVSAGEATAAGALALAALLAGYVVTDAARGYPSSSNLIVFWGLAAILAGPMIGLFAFWIRARRRILAALGSGGISGLLLGEGIYGLAYVRSSTYPPYWWAEILFGVMLLAILAGRGRMSRLDVAVAVGTAAAISAAFITAYSADLIARLPV